MKIRFQLYHVVFWSIIYIFSHTYAYIIHDSLSSLFPINSKTCKNVSLLQITPSNMAPNLFGNSATLFLEASQQDVSQKKSTGEKNESQKLSLQKTQDSKHKYQWKIVWRNVIAFIYLHVGAVYGLYIVLTVARVYTLLWGMLRFIHLYTSWSFVLTNRLIDLYLLWLYFVFQLCYSQDWPLLVLLVGLTDYGPIDLTKRSGHWELFSWFFKQFQVSFFPTILISRCTLITSDT